MDEHETEEDQPYVFEEEPGHDGEQIGENGTVSDERHDGERSDNVGRCSIGEQGTSSNAQKLAKLAMIVLNAQDEASKTANGGSNSTKRKTNEDEIAKTSKTTNRANTIASSIPNDPESSESSGSSDDEDMGPVVQGPSDSDSPEPEPVARKRAAVASKGQVRKPRKRISRRVRPKAVSEDDREEQQKAPVRHTRSKKAGRAATAISSTRNTTALTADGDDEAPAHNLRSRRPASQLAAPISSRLRRSASNKTTRKSKKPTSRKARSKAQRVEDRDEYTGSNGEQLYELERITAVQTNPKDKDPDRQVWYKVKYAERYDSHPGSTRRYSLTAEAMPGSKCKKAASVALEEARRKGGAKFDVTKKTYKVTVVVDEMSSDPSDDGDVEDEVEDESASDAEQVGVDEQRSGQDFSGQEDVEQAGPGQEHSDQGASDQEDPGQVKRTTRRKKRSQAPEPEESSSQPRSQGKRKRTRSDKRSVKRQRRDN